MDIETLAEKWPAASITFRDDCISIEDPDSIPFVFKEDTPLDVVRQRHIIVHNPWKEGLAKVGRAIDDHWFDSREHWTEPVPRWWNLSEDEPQPENLFFGLGVGAAEIFVQLKHNDADTYDEMGWGHTTVNGRMETIRTMDFTTAGEAIQYAKECTREEVKRLGRLRKETLDELFS